MIILNNIKINLYVYKHINLKYKFCMSENDKTSKQTIKRPVREQILKAACRILSRDGIKKLAQPQIAKKAGVPQGHMTYYFPTRSDLLMAVAEKSLMSVAQVVMKRVASKQQLPIPDSISIVEPLIFDSERTRMLVGLLVESDENSDLRKKLIEQNDLSISLVALGLNLNADDEKTYLIHSALLGLCIQYYLNPSESVSNKIKLTLGQLKKFSEASKNE